MSLYISELSSVVSLGKYSFGNIYLFLFYITTCAVKCGGMNMKWQLRMKDADAPGRFCASVAAVVLSLRLVRFGWHVTGKSKNHRLTVETDCW